MSNGILSQEEIDALMRPKPKAEFSAMELDGIGEVFNITMGSAATSLSNMLDKTVDITVPQVEAITIGELDNAINPRFLAVVDFVSGFNGTSVLMLSRSDGATIIDLLMGGDGHTPPQELNEIHLSAIAETMNQMMGSAATALSTMLGGEVNISTPKVSVDEQAKLEYVFPDLQEKVVKIAFTLKVADLINSTFFQIISIKTAKQMVGTLLGKVRQSLVGDDQAQQELGKSAQSQVQVRPLQLAPLQPASVNKAEINNLELILDVPLVLSVELGKVKKTIKEILDFAPGSIIELDKIAGESVDLIANGKLLAKGEVVVINENFGLRITEILGSLDSKLINI